MDVLSKIFWTILALESAWVLMILYSLFPDAPKGGFESSEGLMALMMFGVAALVIGLVAASYLGGVALWFHFKHTPYALAALTPPMLFMISK